MDAERLHILLVDDERSLREPLARFLTNSCGFRVETAADGPAALALAEVARGQFDVALIDRLLLSEAGVEEMDGIEVMRRLRGHYPEVECIILTGWGQEERQRALEQGAFRYQEKPFDNDELALHIRVAAQQVRLRAIGRDILSNLDLVQVLPRVAAAARALTQADAALIALADEPSGELRPAPADDLLDGRLSWEQFAAETDLLGIMRGGVVRSAANLAAEAGGAPGLLSLGYLSFVAAPILGEGRELGVLLILSHEAGHFDAWGHVALAQTLAGQAALAIANARLLADMRRRAADLATLHRLSVDVTSSLDQRHVLSRACQAAVEIFRAEHSGLVIFDDDGAAGTVQAEYPPGLTPLGTRIRVAGVPDEERLLWGETLVIDRVAEQMGLGPVRSLMFDRFNIHSSVFAPVVVRGKVVGSFSVDAVGHTRRFTPDEKELSRLLATQVAVAIDHAQLYEEREQRGDLLQALDEASRHIRAEKEPGRLMHEIVRMAVQLIRCGAGCLFINDPHREELILTAPHGLAETRDQTRIEYGEHLLGRVMRSGEPEFCADYAGSPFVEPLFAAYRFQSALAVPLWAVSGIAAVLFLAVTRKRAWTEANRDVVGRFADQAAIALQASEALSAEQRGIEQQRMLHTLSDYIQSAHDEEDVLRVILTGVTAGWSLGFNRAGLLLLNRTGDALDGRMGVGHLDESLQRADWERDRERNRDRFDRFVERLERDELPPMPVDEAIRSLRLPLAEAGVFAQVVGEKHYMLVHEADHDRLPAAFVRAFEPASPLVVAPLAARGRMLGLLVADNKFTRSPITEALCHALMTFANTAATTIDNAHLYEEARQGREQFRAYFAASQMQVSSPDASAALQEIVERARQAAGADGVGLALMGRNGDVRRMVVGGPTQPADFREMVRDNGLSVEVLRGCRPIPIEDTRTTGRPISRSAFWRNFGAALGLPVILDGDSIGVMWLFFAQPRDFPQAEIEAAQLFANQAAIAHETARRMEELNRMREAAEAMAEAREPMRALERIAEYARLVLRADSVVIWSYDQARRRFVPEELTAAGNVPPDELELIRRMQVTPGKTAAAIMAMGYVNVEDARAEGHTFWGEPTRALYERLGLSSFQGVLLSAGEEKLGILYANYEQPRSFGEADRTTVRTFASDAATALKTARILAQLKRTQAAARAVAGAIVREELPDTLSAIAANCREVLDADVVTLYAYDEAAGRLTTTGQSFADRARVATARPPGEVRPESVIYDLLRLERPPYYLSTNDEASRRRLLRGDFVRAEGVRASAGIKLDAQDHTVGVMFVNYLYEHTFSDDEYALIDLFANEGAAAIRNHQLYRESQRQAGALWALNEAGRVITGTRLSLPDTLNEIAAQALRLVGGDPERCAGHLAIKSGNRRLRFVAAATPATLGRLRREIGILELGDGLTPPARPVGIIGRVALTGEAIRVGDAPGHPDFILFESGTRSELAVPIRADGRVVGVINVESPERDAYTLDDQRALENLAAHAAVAIQNARLYEQTQVVAEISGEAARSLKLTAFLDSVLRRLVELYREREIEMSPSLAILDAPGESLSIYSTGGVSGGFPPDQQPRHRHLTDRGIVTWVANQRERHYAPDVSRDDKYLLALPTTRSELALPAFFGERLLGVLNMESPIIDAFTEEDFEMLATLANQLATTLHNVQQFEELKQTRRMVEARTGLAGMTAIAGEYMHRANVNAVVIAKQLERLKSEMSPEFAEAMARRLAIIEPALINIQTLPSTIPLSSAEGIELLGARDFFREVWQRVCAKGYVRRGTQLHDEITVDGGIGLRANPVWLSHVIDMLIWNAVAAMKEQKGRPKAIKLTVRQAGPRVEVLVQDTGPGIPEPYRALIFKEPIFRSDRSAGLGVGSLLAQLIVQTYGGDIYHVDKSGDSGTTILFWLPVAN